MTPPQAADPESHRRRSWSLHASGWLVGGAAATLFLDSAATFEIGFTIRPSLLFLAAANAVGFRWAVRGWVRLPRAVQAFALLLVLVYLAAALFGHPGPASPELTRTRHRELVYIADLLLGLSTIGLLAGLRGGGWPLWRFVWACLAGLAVGATYAVYQWPAQHFGWVAADLNNSLNTDNYTRGHRHQGTGLFGWERIRGTFKEPLALAAYLAPMGALLLAAMVAAGPGRRRALAVVLTICVVALGLTGSLLTWGITCLVALALAVAWAVARARPRPAAVLGAGLVLATTMTPVLFTNAEIGSAITGRTGQALQLTVQFRQDAWAQAGQAWAPRPILGRGPGQSSVALAYPQDPTPFAQAHVPIVLGSAFGIWAAALIDAGLVGLTAWTLLLGWLFVAGTRALQRRFEPLVWGACVAAAIALAVAQTYGDRLEAKAWLLLGLMAAASCQPAETQAPERRGEADRAAGRRGHGRAGPQPA